MLQPAKSSNRKICSPTCFINAGQYVSTPCRRMAPHTKRGLGGKMGNVKRKQVREENGRKGSLHAMLTKYPDEDRRQKCDGPDASDTARGRRGERAGPLDMGHRAAGPGGAARRGGGRVGAPRTETSDPPGARTRTGTGNSRPSRALRACAHRLPRQDKRPCLTQSIEIWAAGQAVAKDMRVNPFERPFDEGQPPLGYARMSGLRQIDEARPRISYPGRAAFCPEEPGNPS